MFQYVPMKIVLSRKKDPSCYLLFPGLVFPNFSLLCADVNCDFVLILILYCVILILILYCM